MPRRPLVSTNELVASLKKCINYFTTGVPAYSSPVWEEISQDLQKKWTTHNVYNNVKQNRHNVLSIARSEMGVHLPPVENMNIDSDESMGHETDTSSGNESANDERFFTVSLTSEQWEEIKPDGMYFILSSELKKNV